MNVLYFGSDALSLRALTILSNNRGSIIKNLKVVTPPDRLAGRGQKVLTPCAVKSGATRELGLSVIDAPRVAPRPDDTAWADIIDQSRREHFDVAVVFSFGYFLPRILLDAFPQGGINVHPSLLPRYRGAAPIQHALLNGDKETGVCIIEVHPEKFDYGKILLEQRYRLENDSTYSHVSLDLADLGANMTLEVLKDLPRYRQEAKDQIGTPSKAPKLTLQDKFIGDWSKVSSIINKYRAFEVVGCKLKGTPGLTVNLFDVEHVVDVSIASNMENGDAFLSHDRKYLMIKCGKQQSQECLQVGAIQLQGKKIVTAFEFHNGYLLRRTKTAQGVIKDVFE